LKGLNDKVWKTIKNRGFTDKLYFYNLILVNMIMAAILAITTLSGVLGIMDLSPLCSIPQWAYTELGIHTGFIIWKAKAENSRKYRFGTNGKTKEEDEVAPVQPGGESGDIYYE